MKFNLFFVLLATFITIALIHPSAGSECKFPCCKNDADCGSGRFCSIRTFCSPGCGRCIGGK
ncbi:hypothetical protein GLOIN_2v1691464 [Rhizophagus irregularis DAOM 181602=DAOM 197198]|uniref:Uncharacterized protein n=1 Tax=Rhizophagus irregularis (strain DAOM 181602 / DAOM 197198 / MUCL 43194) TaxID=747089 RepID=A0A2P4PBZ1_RHIID|nr:hypothetical protein GLOIN_2v1691464 [Rhizophagus irregularis DAOM 181602=DAOM 197198]POG62901.1 hypothetical protein GLOIN_2v1691464 [Rhizophagus irregularis DAOM 181602=DAOM 197198]|eukprot:XP_025169767.1 hypothetical protein GLOIN_2v1691464 [Rhizophagus irregularis DAOM 181602=DAOM 197198]